MTAISNKLNRSAEINNSNDNEEIDIALDINDLIEVCKSYNRLGWNIQQQFEFLIEFGIDEAIKEKKVSAEFLPHIRTFLKSITDNYWFGDAADQANEVIAMIDNYELKHPHFFRRDRN